MIPGLGEAGFMGAADTPVPGRNQEWRLLALRHPLGPLSDWEASGKAFEMIL